MSPNHIPPPHHTQSCILMYDKCLLMIPRNAKTGTAQISKADTLTRNARLAPQRPLAGPPTPASCHLACSGSFATTNNCNSHIAMVPPAVDGVGRALQLCLTLLANSTQGQGPLEWPQTLRAVGPACHTEPAWVSAPALLPSPPPFLPQSARRKELQGDVWRLISPLQ